MTAQADLATTTDVVARRADGRTGILARVPLARRLPWYFEALIAVAFYWLYNLVQAATESDVAQATHHGMDLVRLEQHMHWWAEPDINRWVTGIHWLALIDGYWYALAHVVVTACVLAYLWWRQPRVQAALRNALIAMSVAALAVYWLYPVAPPRLTVTGMTDTLVSNDILGAAHLHRGLVNLYAAMPSLHVAWACWCAAAITLTSNHRARYLAWLYPIAMTFVVVGTANHYFVDAIAGLLLAAVPLAIVTLRTRRSAGSPASSTTALPIPSQPR
ncbi:MAG: hypothetical protein QOC82_2261 [Frankiaceae bacterium]|jgi:hypothetical protein|nr:hypothetical protein [Frankiaceae bacterium]